MQLIPAFTVLVGITSDLHNRFEQIFLHRPSTVELITAIGWLIQHKRRLAHTFDPIDDWQHDGLLEEATKLEALQEVIKYTPDLSPLRNEYTADVAGTRIGWIKITEIEVFANGLDYGLVAAKLKLAERDPGHVAAGGYAATDAQGNGLEPLEGE